MKSRSLRYQRMPAGNTNNKWAISPRKRCRPWFVFLPRLGMGGR